MKQDIDRMFNLVPAHWGRARPEFVSAKRSMETALCLLVIGPLLGCAAQNVPQRATGTSLTQPSDALFRAGEIYPGKLAYADDRTPFAPILTEPFAYPTQAQAEMAYRRALGPGFVAALSHSIVLAPPEAGKPFAVAASGEFEPTIRLFACKPGALDSETTRIVRILGPVVHCATDFQDIHRQPESRATVNFAYHHGAWHLQATNPPRVPVAWGVREVSPKNTWYWLPGRERYQ